ncbi:MAG: histidine--tRNA ligase [Hasllibacter sp.]
MAKPKKTPRPKAATPRGFRDAMGDEVLRRQRMLARIADVYRMHGFEPLETAAVETAEALGRFLPDLDRPNEGVFAFREESGSEDGEWLALRYDLTAPLARVAAQYRNDLPSPYRRYAMGPVWRNEKPGPGRFRQFYQCDADTVGSALPAADAEVAVMCADALEAAGISRADYVVRLNDRRVLNAVMDAAGVPDGARGTVLRAIDKLDRLGPDGVRALLGEGRTDESGDRTEGAGLAGDQIAHLLAFTGAKGPDAGATLGALRGLVAAPDGVEALEAVAAAVDAMGGAGRVEIDPSVVRGLGYYTGPGMEAELTFEVTDDKGRPRRFGSVAGGGRYDDLVKRFTGQAVPAVGVSIGVDRLLAALEAKGGKDEAEGPVVVTVMDRDRVADSMALAAELRGAGIRAEVYLGNPRNFGNQLKYADQRGAPAAIIEGSDEKARGVVQVKDLALGKAISETATLEEWKDRPAQREVPRAEMVAAVREILGR